MWPGPGPQPTSGTANGLSAASAADAAAKHEREQGTATSALVCWRDTSPQDTPPTLQQAQRQQKGRVRPAELEQQLQQQKRLVYKLRSENVKLRRKESVLLQAVAQTGENVYHLGELLAKAEAARSHQLAAAAAATATATTTAAAASTAASMTTGLARDTNDTIHCQQVAEALLTDLRVQELLQQVGRGSSNTNSSAIAAVTAAAAAVKIDATGDEQQLLPTQRAMQAGVNFERAREVQSMSLQEVAQRMRDLTLQVHFMYHVHGTARERTLGRTLQDAMDAYREFTMLLHIAADAHCVQLCVFNLDILQPQPPPDDWWDNIAKGLKLTKQQQDTLFTGFEVYQSRRLRLVHKIQEIQHQLNMLLGEKQQQQEQQRQQEQQQTFAAAATVKQRDDVAMLDPVSTEPGSQAAGALSSMLHKPTHAGSKAATSPQFNWGVTSSSLQHHLQCAEQLEQLMQQLIHHTGQVREVTRTMTMLAVNALDLEQSAAVVAESYPWFPQPAPIIDYLYRQRKCS